MNDAARAVRDELIAGLYLHYDMCKNTAKNERCLIIDNVDDLPCKCQRARNIRQQILWLEEDIKKKAN